MSKKYKIICVTDAVKAWNSHENLEREVNTFLDSPDGKGFFPLGAPVYIGNDLMQVLVSTDLLDG